MRLTGYRDHRALPGKPHLACSHHIWIWTHRQSSQLNSIHLEIAQIRGTEQIKYHTSKVPNVQHMLSNLNNIKLADKQNAPSQKY